MHIFYILFILSALHQSPEPLVHYGLKIDQVTVERPTVLAETGTIIFFKENTSPDPRLFKGGIRYERNGRLEALAFTGAVYDFTKMVKETYVPLGRVMPKDEFMFMYNSNSDFRESIHSYQIY